LIGGVMQVLEIWKKQYPYRCRYSNNNSIKVISNP
jgi:hypothetical protein